MATQPHLLEAPTIVGPDDREQVDFGGRLGIHWKIDGSETGERSQ